MHKTKEWRVKEKEVKKKESDSVREVQEEADGL